MLYDSLMLEDQKFHGYYQNMTIILPEQMAELQGNFTAYSAINIINMTKGILVGSGAAGAGCLVSH